MVSWPPCHMVNSTSDAIWGRVKYSCTTAIEFLEYVEIIRSLLPSTLLEKTPLKVLNIHKKATSTVHEIHKKNIMCALCIKKERLGGGVAGPASLGDYYNCL
jgi:hypothetical protein